jgi:hypothetical protein
MDGTGPPAAGDADGDSEYFRLMRLFQPTTTGRGDYPLRASITGGEEPAKSNVAER